MSSRWYDHARKVIERAYAEGLAQGITGHALRVYVDNHYPFGQREYHPYTMWLRARRDVIGGKVPGVKAPKETPTGKAVQAERAALDAWNAGQPIRGEG